MQIAKQMDLLTNMRVHSFLGKFGLITQGPDSIQKISDFNFLENLLAHCQAKLQINTQVKSHHYINYRAHDVLWT